MAGEIIYSVFVSSTYEDLREERAAVQKALLQLHCMPIGMELFGSADEETWEFIKGQIDNCDYYVLMVADKYGSTAADGLSYTEKEYDYAREAKKPVLAFLRGDRGSIPRDKTELDPQKRSRLEAFIEKVRRRSPSSFFTTPHDLATQVSISFVNLRDRRPAVGFIRANQVLDLKKFGEALEEIARLRAMVSAQNADPGPRAGVSTYRAVETIGLPQRELQHGSETHNDFEVRTIILREDWSGFPGYSADLKYPELHGGASAQTSDEINLVFRAQSLSALLRLRSRCVHQDPARWEGKPAEVATSRETIGYKIAFLSSKAISVVFNVEEYSAGAAHGYHRYVTRNFLLQPTSDLSLSSFFRDHNYGQKLGKEAREALRRKAKERNEIKFDEQHLNEGTAFGYNEQVEFTFDQRGLTLYFQEYQIGPYSIGSWEIMLPYDNLREILHHDWPHELTGFS